MSRGRISKSAVSASLTPANSVSDSINFDFGLNLGSATVRFGTTPLGSAVASGKTPLGLTAYSTTSLTTNLVVGVFSGASTASVYYYDTSWHTSGVTNLDNTAKNRFSNLGGRIFRVNGVTAMASSTNGNSWGTTNCLGVTTPHIVGLVFRQKNRLLAAGDTVFPSRIWFSSVIDPAASPSLTWKEGNLGGDFIDVNPDDGDYITGFEETATLTLVFKSNALYRLAVISNTADTENIFNVGAVSQEAIVRCQGSVYFFSGKDIRMTSGDFPTQISRLGVQDYIDALPQTSWKNVAAGADDWNVWFDIGDITLDSGQDTQRTIKDVRLKFSTRDQSWSVHSMGNNYRFFTKYTSTTNGKTVLGADTNGNVQIQDLGQSDNGRTIFYSLDTQELELGQRENTKEITGPIALFTKNGQNMRIEMSHDDQDSHELPIEKSPRVSIARNVSLRGKFFGLHVEGESTGKQPVFEGFVIQNINDSGIN